MTSALDAPASATRASATRAPAARASAARVSIIVSTLNRADDLERALGSLRWLSSSPAFEVVVVAGPSTDRTDEVLAEFDGLIKRVDCPVANLSVSRNLGIAAAAGDIVAFMDDDAVPEPEWLAELAPAFDDASVAAAGGFVVGHDGLAYQYRYGLFDRFGWPQPAHDVPGRAFVFPDSWLFPHLIGTNSAYRRSTLVEIGGFDEEYDYFLDDTDVVVRLIDRGWDVVQVAGAHVHHKFAPSAMRSSSRVAADRRSILKNHTYFGIRHAARAVDRADVDAEADAFVDQQRGEMERAVADGLLDAEHVEAYESYAAEQVAKGRLAAVSAPALGSFGVPPTFLPFETLVGETAGHVLLDDPTASDDVLDEAMMLAASGGVPHLIRPAEGLPNRDFSRGVWIHSIDVTGDGGWASAAAIEREAVLARFPAAADDL